MTGLLMTIPAATALLPQSGSGVDSYDNTLTIEWHHKMVFAREHRVEFTGGAIAKFGPTTITAEKITLWLTDTRREGEAQGQVHLDDPIGHIDGDLIDFNWTKKTGEGKNVSIVADDARISADTIHMTEKGWEMTNAYATPFSQKHPVFETKAPKIVIKAGSSVKATKPSFYLFKKKVITLPSYKFGLGNRGGGGISLPAVSYSAGAGFGFSWRNDFQLDDRTDILAGFAARQQTATGANVQYSRSMLPSNGIIDNIPPISDLNERFFWGYFDNVYVRTPRDEEAFVNSKRQTIAVGAALNQGSVGRRQDALFTKPAELIYEASSAFDGFHFIGQGRLQSIRQESGPNNDRGMLTGILATPPITLARGLRTSVRLDGTAYLQGGGDFEWGQAQLGLIYDTSRYVRFGAAYVYGGEQGRPIFEADRLFSAHAVHLRTDLDLGHTHLNVLSKFDTDGRDWYDTEFGVSQQVGILEPYFIYRQFPKGYSFGLRLRVDSIVDALERRQKIGTQSKK